MATAKRSTKRGDNPLIARLKALGCTYCEPCRAFMYPDHIEHMSQDRRGEYSQAALAMVSFLEGLDGQLEAVILPDEVAA